MKKILLLLLLPIFGFAQVQIGEDINAEAPSDYFGFSTSVSTDGNIVAIGAPFNDGNGSNSGHVRVMENQGGTWVQIGEDIDGEDEGDSMGRSVSLSGDGRIVAVGAEKNDGNGNNAGHVRIFENQNGTWVQLGEDIDGEGSSDLSGTSVSLSKEGNIVAIGAPGNSSGYVRVFRNQGGTWEQIGEKIEGEESYTFYGGSISLSADGNVLAIGAEFHSENGENIGYVQVYKNQSDSWTQVGGDINGIAAGDFFGKAVALSEDGITLAINSGGNASSSGAGYAQVFENQSDTWVQIGEDILGEAEGDIYLSSPSDNIALSADGRVLAIGARHNDGNGESSGHVRVFINTGDTWLQVGEDIDGEAEDDLSGQSVSLSSDGSTLVIGSRQNEGTGSNAGHVRVFGVSDIIISTDNPKAISFAVYPNPASEEIMIQVEQNDTFEQVSIYNSLGQQVNMSNLPTINISNLPKGIYVVKVETSEGSSSQNIIVF